MRYEYIKKDDVYGSIDKIARYNDDETISYIPIDESNSDYQAYLNKDKPQTPMVIDEASAE